MIDRRTLLKALALGAIAGPVRSAGAAFEATRVGIWQLDPGWGALPRERAFPDLLEEVGLLTSIRVDPEPHRVSLAELRSPAPPLLALAGGEAFTPPGDAAVTVLRDHLGAGGFLLIDDTSGLERSPFHDAAGELLGRIFPDTPLAPLEFDHAVFRSFFLVDGAVGRLAVRPYLEGIAVGQVTPVIVSRNDLCGAWERAPGGGYAREVVPGGERQRTRALELGVNLVTYALTANYKKDVVHVEALLRRLREEGRIP